MPNKFLANSKLITIPQFKNKYKEFKLLSKIIIAAIKAYMQ